MRHPDRENAILELLARRQELSVSSLASSLAVSEATMRRDLQAMERRGLLRRLHGGATLNGVSRIEPLFSDKEGLNTAAKRAIALVAVRLIADGDHVYLDGGSTVLMLARLLDRKRRLTIVTNSLMAAALLLDTEHRLVLVGGEFRSLSRTLVGPLTAPIINALHVCTAFMGTIGFTVADGMTTTDPGEGFTKSQIMARADRVVLLADSSKFGVRSFARSGAVSDVGLLITERIEADLRRELEQRGVEVQVAPSDPSPAGLGPGSD